MRTRPAICWSDLSGARVGVWGLGIEGTANLQRLGELGADFVVVEDSPPPARVLGHEVLAIAEGGLEALRTRDVVVKTPGVRRRRPEVAQLEAAGIPVVGGLGLWLQEAPRERVLVITGTKGKSTTTAIAGHLLDQLGYRTLVAGNIGRAPYDPSLPSEFDYAIIEVSSFQATDLAVSPPVVAVTSLHPDHLDWHGGVEEYFRDKLSACSQPGADLTVADGGSPLLHERVGQLGPRVRWVGSSEQDLGGRWLETLGLPGVHNRRNAMIARACLLGLGVPEAADGEAMAAAAEGFEGLDSRLRTIGTVAGVRFVDDSLATNVLPTVAALEAYGRERVALIVGGHDRGIDYGPLAEALSARAARAENGVVAVFTLPENGARISAQIRQHLGASAEVTECEALTSAVRLGFAWARQGSGVVLLSPAAPSFGHFRDYKDRAAVFADAMERCAASS
ncbi:MAG: UDP-N-acetylmuramoyl-L-alanine--D-glutamate ligase [Acidimicrobiales bacterium]|jgi:UDP-N-acetylmuramoylalanine--D-glutamate ligase